MYIYIPTNYILLLPLRILCSPFNHYPEDVQAMIVAQVRRLVQVRLYHAASCTILFLLFWKSGFS